jgi:hypothetical protein
MATDPASDLHQYIGELIYTALESTRLGFTTDTQTATDITTDNIMAAVYAARPAINPQQGPGYPSQPPEYPQPQRRPRHGWIGARA